MFKVTLSLILGAACITVGAAYSLPLLMAAPCVAVMFATALKG